MTEKIKVVITDEQKTLKVPKGLRMLVRRACLAALSVAGCRGSTEIHVCFTDNDGIRELNRKLFGSSNVEELLFATRIAKACSERFISRLSLPSSSRPAIIVRSSARLPTLPCTVCSASWMMSIPQRRRNRSRQSCMSSAFRCPRRTRSHNNSKKTAPFQTEGRFVVRVHLKEASDPRNNTDGTIRLA